MARLSTSAPQWAHTWGLQREEPRWRPIATLIMPSSMRRPRDEIGSAFNKAQGSLVEAARRRARYLASGAFSRRLTAISVTLGASKAIWCRCAEPLGGERLWPWDHWALASSKLGIGELWRCGGMMWWTRSQEAAVCRY